VGAFHRAHQAFYLHRLRLLGAADWRLVGGNIRQDDEELLRYLAASRGRYTLETISPSGQYAYELIESIERVIPWAPGHPHLIDVGARQDTRIISFTVTEAGYYLDGERLQLQHPTVTADIVAAREGRAGNTLYGVLSSILSARQRLGGGPVTLLCCDNLRHNGARARYGLRQFLEAADMDDLLEWMDAAVTFPNCMVDRITPRPDAALRERVKSATGADDQAAVGSESFLQWVVEDRFARGRPDWERVGVQMVESVTPYEEMKIRILNGSHSCIAWAAALSGHEFIHDALHDARVRQLTLSYIDDVLPCLAVGGRLSISELQSYRDAVLERFSNSHLHDRTARVAQDSYRKYVGFVAPTLWERLSVGADIHGVAALPVLLLRFWQRHHRRQLAFTYQDSNDARESSAAICSAPDPLAALCRERFLFGDIAGEAPLLLALRAAAQRVDALFGSYFDSLATK
jgi:D-arabinitol 4-dehydrogenase